MPAYILKELPLEFGNLFESIIKEVPKISASPQNTLAQTQMRFCEEIIYRQSREQVSPEQRQDVGRDWWMYEINLENPWHNIKHIRLFSHAIKNYEEHYYQEKSGGFKKKPPSPSYEAFLVLKDNNGQFDIYHLDEGQALSLNYILPTLTHRRRLGILDQSVIRREKWDNLQIYSKEVKDFYRTQNQAMSTTLFQLLSSRKNKKPFLIIDLGAGKGMIANNFMAYISLKGYEWADTYWINVDLSEENTKIAQDNLDHHRISCIAARAVDFLQNPLHHFREIGLPETFWAQSDVYVLASGLFSEGVMHFSDCVQTLRALNNPSIKGILLTSMHASHVSPYLAKQLGFERVNIDLASVTKDSIDFYEPMTQAKQMERVVGKIQTQHFLDLSYVPDLTRVLKCLEKADLSKVEHILLSGVRLESVHVPMFNQLHEKYSHIKIWAASISPEEKSLFESVMDNVKHPIRFISLGYVIASPLFSPTFFHKLSATISEESEHSLLINFMRGVITNLVTREVIPLDHRLLTVKLFLALNADPTNDPARHFLHELLQRETLSFSLRVSQEELLREIQASQLSDPLKRAATAFIQCVPVDALDLSNDTLFKLQRNVF